MIGAYIFCVVLILAGIVGAVIAKMEKSKEFLIFSAVWTLISVLLTGFCIWFFSCTATGARATKDFKSSLHGLEREITITAEDGREIYHYSGKCDIETQDKYILFEDENGKRQTIYWGALDTIIIQEK